MSTYLGTKEPNLKYTKEITDRLIDGYKTGTQVKTLAEELKVPPRSVIAKLASLGIYEKKLYTNKRGEVPTKKSEHIERIAQLLEMPAELLESLEKVNKQVLIAIERKLQQTGP